jgi:glycosyltransferase involved in cell wall biosynthesis
MGCGCAVVCSDLPALRDVVKDGNNGRVFPAGNDAALATLLKELLTDASLVEKIAADGRASVVERFDWATVAADYGQCYRTLMAKGVGGE